MVEFFHAVQPLLCIMHTLSQWYKIVSSILFLAVFDSEFLD